MNHGTVKWYNVSKGYGFISPQDGGTDVFVHHSAIRSRMDNKALAEGQRVSFELEHAPKGRSAANVTAL